MPFLFEVIVVLLIVGVLLWGLARAPWLDADFKQLIRMIVIVIVAIWLILNLATMFGVTMPGAYRL